MTLSYINFPQKYLHHFKETKASLFCLIINLKVHHLRLKASSFKSTHLDFVQLFFHNLGI